MDGQAWLVQQYILTCQYLQQQNLAMLGHRYKHLPYHHYNLHHNRHKLALLAQLQAQLAYKDHTNVHLIQHVYHLQLENVQLKNQIKEQEREKKYKLQDQNIKQRMHTHNCSTGYFKPYQKKKEGRAYQTSTMHNSKVKESKVVFQQFNESSPSKTPQLYKSPERSSSSQQKLSKDVYLAPPNQHIQQGNNVKITNSYINKETTRERQTDGQDKGNRVSYYGTFKATKPEAEQMQQSGLQYRNNRANTEINGLQESKLQGQFGLKSQLLINRQKFKSLKRKKFMSVVSYSQRQGSLAK